MRIIETLIAVYAIQFFADAGNVVNATATITNAYTGQSSDRGAGNKMSDELKDFYDTELLENTRIEQYYGQFAKRARCPKRHNGTVEWRKFNKFAPATALVEAVIPTGQEFGETALKASVTQYGTYTAISDKLELMAFDDIILEASKEMSASAALTSEKLTRDLLLTGTNVLYCDNVADDGSYKSTPTSASQLGCSASTGYARLTSKMVNKAATIMKKNRVPKINGKYYMVVNPSVANDLKNDAGWQDTHKYSQPGEIFRGEIGELWGVRFIESEFAPILKGADLASDGRFLYVNKSTGYTGAITTVAFDGGTVAANALKDRVISINGVTATVTANTASTITFASTNFGNIADNVTIYPADGGADDIASYACYMFGKDAFGLVDMEGGGLEMVIHDKGEIGGPLDQFSTIGYKMYHGGAILYQERLLRIMCVSQTFSATDAAN